MSEEYPMPLSTEEIERSFLRLDKNHNPDTAIPPVEDFLDKLLILNECNDTTRRDQCYMVLQQHLVDTHDFAGLIKLLKMRSEWLGNPVVYGEECHDILVSSTKDRMLIAIADSVAFGTEKPFECLKNLELLCALVPGAACCDKTWGYGVVNSKDDFYKRIVVDFDRKPNHTMAFSYAVQALTLLDEKHILAVRHADETAFKKMCEDNPGDVVLLALNSFGTMSVSRLESEMSNGILPEGVDWKTFWSKARSQLKKNRRVKLPPPSKKNEAIEYSETVSQTGDKQWFNDLADTQDVEEILTRLTEFAQGKGVDGLTDEQRAIIADRFSFALKANATKRNDKDKIRTIMLAISYGFNELPVALRARKSDEFAIKDDDSVDLRGTLCKPEIVLRAATKLPATSMGELVDLIPFEHDAKVAHDFIEAIDEVPHNLMEKLAPKLLSGPASREFIEKVRTEFTQIDVPFPLLLWLCRNQDQEGVRDIIPSAVVTTQALLSLEFEVMGESLRLQHQIARLFRDEEWLASQTERMTDVERSSLYERIRAVEGAWEPSQKRSIEKFLLAKHPHIIASAQDGSEVAAPASGDLKTTSWRSLNERREKLRILVEEEIPQNAKDIETARGYGDLRENFEYQTAKDQQSILLQRQSEMSLLIQDMKGTDFSGVEVLDKVVVGSSVTIMFADNHSETYNILGEWDSDLALGIIPSRSRLAEVLTGRAVNDKVMIPSEDGEEEVEVTVLSIQPLSRTVLDWASGR